jgi:hypothetical protein
MKKVEVDLAVVRALLKERRRINRATLEQLVFRDRATTFTATPQQLDRWRFTGMNNLDFIDFEILRKPPLKRRKP